VGPIGRSLKVLYVEDNEDIRRVFDVLLKLTIGAETEVLLASDGQEGLELALREKPDVVFLDEELPVMDGFEVTRRLRDEDSFRDVPVVMVSGHLNHEDRRRRAHEAGVTLLMDKPFQAKDLGDAVVSVLRR
jgi:two-component system cell cycle response regulator DivK